MKIEKITNIGKDNFMLDRGNGVYANAVALASNVPELNADMVTLYAFNIQTGVATEKVVKMPSKHIKPEFARAFVCAYYEIQYKNAVSQKGKFDADKPKDMTEEEKAAYAVMETRYNLVRDVRNAHTVTPCDTAKDLANAIAKRPIKDYSALVQGKIAELAKINVSAEEKNGNTIVNLKEYRKVLNELTTTMWRESEYCEKYVYNANATLTYDISCVAHSTLGLESKTGFVKALDPKNNIVMEQIMLHILQDLQNK